MVKKDRKDALTVDSIDLPGSAEGALALCDEITYEYYLDILDKTADGEGFKRLMEAKVTWRR